MKKPRSPSAATLPADDPFWILKRKVIEETGHYYYIDKDDVLLERLRQRLTATRDADLGAYLARLDDPAVGPEEWRALEGAISIGETFFFRYEDQFEALKRDILPDLLSRRSQSRRLRIWSAGCSTGAEAYSIAILLDEMLGQALADWRISILGTDLNNEVLNTARRAVYSPWTLRSLGPEQRRTWFTESGGRWSLKTRYRGLVRFARNNLLDLLGPAPPLELVEFDLILCRNVLIYFHPDQVIAVARALVDRLQPDGWLLVGHAEANPTFSTFAQAVLLDDAVAYQPLAADARPARSPPAPAASPPSAFEPPAWTPPQPPTRAPRPALPDGPSTNTESPIIEDAVEKIRTLADRGELNRALDLAQQVLPANAEVPALHYYMGLVLHALGRYTDAEAALRRAVYLDPGLVMGHYQLGVTRLAEGKTVAGRRSIKTAATLAGGTPANTPLAHGANLTAADVRDLARLHLEAGQREAR